MSNMHWKKAADFAEIAEALKVETQDIMAAMISPNGKWLALYTPVPADDDPMIHSAQLERDADDILVAGPSRTVALTSEFVKDMNERIGPRLEAEFGPPTRGFTEGYHGTIPPYDVEPDDEDPEERDE